MKAPPLSAISICLALSVTGCSSGDSDNSNNTTNGATTGSGGNSGSGTSTLAMPTETQGAWYRACAPQFPADEFNDTWLTSVLEISANSAYRQELYYTDNLCTQPTDIRHNVEVSWSLYVHSAAVATTSGDATAVDWTTASASADGKPINFGETYYDINKVLNGNLYFGDENQSANVGESPAERATQLDFITYYERPAQ